MRLNEIMSKYKIFRKQKGLFVLLYFILRKIYFIFYKYLFNECKSVFIAGSFRITGKENIKIGKLFAGRRIVIDAIKYFNQDVYQPSIIIGNDVSFGDDIHIACTNKIEIGNNVLLGSHIYITDHDHGIYNGENVKHSPPDEIPAYRKLTNNAYVIIGNNVHIGEYVSILKNVKIGQGSIIGSNSVVTKNIPEYSIAVGNPAKVLKKYCFKEQKWLNVTEIPSNQ
jgi:lipopolysaccharide O-acetyltransferase